MASFTHRAWATHPKEHGGFGGALQLDLLSDLTKSISRDYGVLLEEVGLSLRGTFLIDGNSVLRHISIGPPTGWRGSMPRWRRTDRRPI